MNKSMDDIEFRRYLAAFADGELDVEQNLRVLEHMAMNPLATRRVMHQQQLHQAVDRILRSHTPIAPEALKLKVQQLAADTLRRVNERDAHAPSRHRQPPPRTSLWLQIGRWTPLALAALLFIAALMVPTIKEGTSQPISRSRYAMFVSRHSSCSRTIEQLRHTEQFPQNLKELPGAMADFLGDRLPRGLDLSSIGYEFHAVGECNVPGNKSVHLIYRATTDPTGQDTLSVWVRRYTGTADIEPDKPYLLAGTGVVNPLIMWRQGSMIYYLVGNSLTSVESAKNLLSFAG